MTLTLDQLRPGDRASVVRLAAAGPVAQRLAEMGLIVGTELRLVRTAPLGDPIEIELFGWLLSLRKAEARFVEVAPAATP